MDAAAIIGQIWKSGIGMQSMAGHNVLLSKRTISVRGIGNPPAAWSRGNQCSMEFGPGFIVRESGGE